MLAQCEKFHNEWCMSSKSKMWSPFKIVEGKQKKYHFVVRIIDYGTHIAFKDVRMIDDSSTYDHSHVINVLLDRTSLMYKGRG